ncbi:hypothetical protein N9B29_02085 [bacterium]|nr:hypothetical protein [bacterium]
MFRCLLISPLLISSLAQAQTKAKEPRKPFSPKLDAVVEADRLHPLFKLENLYPEQDVQLKISAMAFHGDVLYVTVFTPDRQNKAPFKKGEIFKVTGLIGNSDRSKVKAQRLMGDLYEPTAIAVHEGKIYVGEKDMISRLEDRNGDGVYTTNEKVILIDGISQPNFHTYTVGFETIKKDGKVYLAGNLTTSVRLGGSRDLNVTVNPKTKRGSTFLLGPITGREEQKDVDIEYFSGGYRTPNGFAVGPNQEMIVLDNQGFGFGACFHCGESDLPFLHAGSDGDRFFDSIEAKLDNRFSLGFVAPVSHLPSKTHCSRSLLQPDHHHRRRSWKLWPSHPSSESSRLRLPLQIPPRRQIGQYQESGIPSQTLTILHHLCAPFKIPIPFISPLIIPNKSEETSK